MRGRGRAAAGNRTPGPRGSYLGGYSAGRGIYSRYHEGKTKQPEKPYELMPSLELAASVNPVGIKPGTSQWDERIRLCPRPISHFPTKPLSCVVWGSFKWIRAVAGWSWAEWIPLFEWIMTQNVFLVIHDQKAAASFHSLLYPSVPSENCLVCCSD